MSDSWAAAWAAGWLTVDPTDPTREPSREYPHKCPRCGGEAYVGFNVRVLHRWAPEGAKEECP